MSNYPAEEFFPTGKGNETLVLLACAGFLWAGRYANSTKGTPHQIAVTTTRRVTTKNGSLLLGRNTFHLHPRAMQRACRWLSRQGITVREHRA